MGTLLAQQRWGDGCGMAYTIRSSIELSRLARGLWNFAAKFSRSAEKLCRSARTNNPPPADALFIRVLTCLEGFRCLCGFGGFSGRGPARCRHDP